MLDSRVPSWGHRQGQGGACLPVLCWDSRTAFGLASHVVSLIWVFFAAAPYALPQPPHQQLVAYCFFKKKVEFNAINLSCRAKIHLLVSRETLLLSPRNLMAVTAVQGVLCPPPMRAARVAQPSPPPHCAPLKPTCLPHLHAGGKTQGRI